MVFRHSLLRAVLPGVVFVTGACILIVEVLATRVLAPYFGSTLYTISSVIGVVLGALSLGYAIGGRIADARPSPGLFYGLIAAGGLSIFALEALLLFVMPRVGYQLPFSSGPLIVSLALFFIPSALLGCLSPFAITLQQQRFPAIGIGTLTGEMFFWSTLGSIVGSLGSGFFLIPTLGIHALFIGVGTLLVCLGGIGMIVFRPHRARRGGIIGLAVILVIILPALSTSVDAQRQSFVYLDDGVYERVAITDGIYQGRPTRFLEQDRSLSSAMFLDSDELAFDYTKYYALASLLVPEVRTTLVLGAGAYSVPKALLADYPSATVDVVDIEPTLYDLSKQFFRFPDSARVTPYTTDARRFLREPPRQYDLIFSDIYSSLYALPVHASTREFFGDVKRVLKPDGVFIANVIGSLSREEPSILFSLMRTFRAEFDNTVFIATGGHADLSPQNIIFIGINGANVLDLSSPDIMGSHNPIISALPSRIINPERYDLSAYPVFTDVYAPVEYATQHLFRSLTRPHGFSGDESMTLIRRQLAFGSRAYGTPGHAATQEFLQEELRVFADEVHVQEGSEDGLPVKNIIAHFKPNNERRIIFATHYDTNPSPQTPGANNGASGTAVLLEFARVLARAPDEYGAGVDLVFFDGEEGPQGAHSPDWRPLGSEYFVTHLDELYKIKKPLSAVVIDMVCERGARFEKEQSSLKGAPDLVNTFWTIARGVSPDIFPDTTGPLIRDDHTALQAAGIPSLLLIDFEYPWIYSLDDTTDKCSANSLQSVGDALLSYLKKKSGVDDN